MLGFLPNIENLFKKSESFELKKSYSHQTRMSLPPSGAVVGSVGLPLSINTFFFITVTF
jgi:hypothetical protein